MQVIHSEVIVERTEQYWVENYHPIPLVIADEEIESALERILAL